EPVPGNTRLARDWLADPRRGPRQAGRDQYVHLSERGGEVAPHQCLPAARVHVVDRRDEQAELERRPNVAVVVGTLPQPPLVAGARLARERGVQGGLRVLDVRQLNLQRRGALADEHVDRRPYFVLDRRIEPLEEKLPRQAQAEPAHARLEVPRVVVDWLRGAPFIRRVVPGNRA